MKKDDEYEGLRCTISAQLGKLKSRTQIDIAFGDAVPFQFKKKSIPTILDDFDSPELLIYPMESVIAEKFQAIVYLGEANSRMKDFNDIWFLAQNNIFVSGELNRAIKVTFAQVVRRINDFLEPVITAGKNGKYLEWDCKNWQWSDQQL